MLLFGPEVETAMICAKCRRQIDAGVKRCPACASDPLLADRYRLDRSLAADAGGASYRATQSEDGLRVRARALPRPSLADLSNDRSSLGDALDEHLARLETLDHPALPRLLDHHLGVDESGVTLWLIYEELGGRPLSELAAAEPERVRDPGWLLELIVGLAGALAHLHAHTPPLVHGAVAPAQVGVRTDSSGSTFTLLELYGPELAPEPAAPPSELALVAPEQRAGSPAPASDVWALGMVVVLLLGAEQPSTPGDPQRALDWRGQIEDARLRELLESMLAPDPAARAPSAKLRDAARCLLDASMDAPQSRQSRQARQSRPRAESRTPPTTPRSTTPSPRFMMSEPMPPRPSPAPAAPPLPRSPRLSSARSSSTARRRAAGNHDDVPIMRPEDLSRELSQAYHATTALEQRQRKHLAYARVLVILIAATITALATYLALKL